ncbi:MAG TPA: serine/threonine-protein kinase [Polyangia bacterium]
MLGERDQLVGVELGGAYRLVGRIGDGGMGAVYEAHHLRLQKRVAVKVMKRESARHPEALERFRREAIVTSRLGHPNLVNVIDCGISEDGEPYLVMEFLEGEDLDHRIRRAGPVPLQTAVRIVHQVASAVAAVHAKGIVHRDLKPANIFLVQVPGEPDFVKVLDFGVSKIKAVQTKLTDASITVGTPDYMSPEQVAGSGDLVDHRTDQWALACIVWEMLAGQAPFCSDDPNALFYQLQNLPPPPLAQYASDLPAGIEPVLLRALSKRPVDRYGSVREFARALESAALGTWTEPTPLSSALTTIPDSGELAPSSRPSALSRLLPTFWRNRATLLWPRMRPILAVLAVAAASAGVALLFTGGRSKPPASSQTMQSSRVRALPASIQPYPIAALDESSTQSTTVADQPASTGARKAKTAQPRSRQFESGSIAPHDSAAGKSRPSESTPRGQKSRGASNRGGEHRKHLQLTIDDF